MKATEVTAGLAESNGSLLPGLWRDSLLVTCGLTACTPGSAPGPTLGYEYGKTFNFNFNFYLCMCITYVACSWYSIDDDMPSADDRYLAMVDYEGGVNWFPFAKFRSGCQIDMRSFPFDEQRSPNHLPLVVRLSYQSINQSVSRAVSQSISLLKAKGSNGHLHRIRSEKHDMQWC